MDACLLRHYWKLWKSADLNDLFGFCYAPFLVSWMILVSWDDIVSLSAHTVLSFFLFTLSRIHIYDWSDVSVPFVPDRRQTSGIQAPLQTQTGLWRRARLGCGSELWSQLQTTSRLQRVKQSQALYLEGLAHLLWSAIKWCGPHRFLPRQAGIHPAGCPAWVPGHCPSLPWWWGGEGSRRRLRWTCNTSRSGWRPWRDTWEMFLFTSHNHNWKKNKAKPQPFH